MSILDAIHSLSTNVVFTGVAGGAVMTAVLYQVRALPARVWGLTRHACLVTMEIDNSEEIFYKLGQYLAEANHARRARSLRMAEFYDYRAERWRWDVSLGVGIHLIRDHGAWFLFTRTVADEAKGETVKRRQSFYITTFGRGQRAIRDLVKRAEAVNENADSIRVHIFHQGFYILADQKPARSLDTVFIPDEQKARIIADVDRFVASRAEYRRKGIPWRRGYLFEGPPGTGKTTLAYALASHVGRPVHVVNLNTCGGDSGLLLAFNSAGSESFVVIEDIDTLPVSHARDVAAPAAGATLDPAEAVTLSGLLNAIDGVAARAGRILVITTNRPEVLDAALTRAGRVDLRETIGLIDVDQARAMCRLHLPELNDDWFDREIAPELPMAPATLQQRLLQEAR